MKNENNWVKYPDYLTDSDWKEWSANNLTSAKDGLYIVDVDAVLRRRMPNGVNAIKLIEKKCQNAAPAMHQEITMKLINELLAAGAKALGNVVTIHLQTGTYQIPISYTGFDLLQLSNNTFSDSSFKINGVNYSNEELIKFLSLE